MVLLSGVLAGTFLALASGRRTWGPHLAFEMAAAASFALLLVAERRARWLTPRLVGAAGGILLLGAVAFPPSESADVWAYVMYGRISVVHGANPYTASPGDFPHDRWVRLVRPIWRDSPSLYGPVFQGIAAAVVRAARGSALRARLGFQLLAAVALAGVSGLVGWRTRAPPAVALLALNPLVMIGVVNGAHPDAALGLAILGAVLLAERDRGVAAGAVIGLGALVKVVALFPAGIVVLWTRRRRGCRAAAACGAATGAVTVGGYLLVGGWASLRALGTEFGLTNRFALWRLAWWIHPAIHADGERHLGHPASWAATAVILGLALVAAMPALRDAGAGRAVALAVAVFLLGGLYVQPWYVMWLLPVAALLPGPAPRLAVAYQAALAVAYGLALIRGPSAFGLAARDGFFVLLAAAEAVAILWLAARGVGELRARSAEAPAAAPFVRPP